MVKQSNKKVLIFHEGENVCVEPYGKHVIRVRIPLFIRTDAEVTCEMLR